MAQCKQTPQEFIKNAFTPQIAVICTPVAQKCCQKNNLDLTELLQPFSRLNHDVYFKDPNGAPLNIRNLKLTFLDLAWRPPQTPSARKLLNCSVKGAPESRSKTFQVGKYKLDIPSSIPWFEAWRDAFLKVQYPSDHEFTKHFLACILVVSSLDNNITESFDQLAQNLNVDNTTPEKLPKWFNSNVLKYYVVIHDNTELNSTLGSTFDTIQHLYGPSNCFLLRINSRLPQAFSSEHLPDPWSQFISHHIDFRENNDNSDSNVMKNSLLEIGQEAEEIKIISDYHPLSPINDDLTVGDLIMEDDKSSKRGGTQKIHGICLSTDDVEQVKLLVYEFTKSCLLPYVEKQIFLLNDMVSNKKGMSKSLFSATKRWFSPNKPGASSAAVNNLIYSPDSPELQVRRLGDLYFMFGHYSLAFQAYHLAKRDYLTDQAWLYYAGALEMAALSAFMAKESNKKTCDYMEESILTYLNTCKMPQFATRATILSSECLKDQNLYGEAAHQLIRMTSEESDLRSALLLEQAAYCFLESKMVRKYAFHMVLAGHRFSKAAQRKHSLKCYKQAYQIYEDTSWDLACDHIHYTIGRQANNLQHFDKAIDSFSKLLKGESKQSAQQQALFLREYLTILGNKLKTDNELNLAANPFLPVPELDINSLKILVGPTQPLSTPGKIPAQGINFNNADDSSTESQWNKLEEMLVEEASGPQPIVFKPLVTLYTLNNLERNTAIAVVNEPIQISLLLVNSLQTPVHLKDIYLSWSFSNDSEETITNEVLDIDKDQYLKTHIMKSVTIMGNSKYNLVLALTPLLTGQITLNGFCYTLTGSDSATETAFVKGKQLITIPDNKSGNMNGCGNNLEIKVVPTAPCLQVTFSEINLENCLADELQRVSIDFQNTSTVPLKNIYMATSVPHLLCNWEFVPQNSLELSGTTIPQYKEKYLRKNHVTSVPLPGDVLEPGQSTTIYMWVKAPSKKGPSILNLLIYYENVKTSIPRYRLVRHTWNLSVQESISIDVSTQASHNSKTVEELTLAIKITNLNRVHNSVSTEVMLLNVGLLSKNWSLSKDIVTPQYINLHSQESVHILLKAKRTVRSVSEYSSVPLSADKKSIQNLMNTYLAYANKAEKPMLTIFDDIDLYTFNENEDGLLLLQWQALVIDAAKKRIVNGQCQTSIEINRKEDVLQMERILSDMIIDISEKTLIEEENAQLAQKQIYYNLVYSPVVEHDFGKEMLCIVPVQLLLHSVIDNGILSVAVNTTESSVKPPKMNKSNIFDTNASSSFGWLGNSKIVKNLKPLTTEAVHLAVILPGPGTFDLGAHIQVLCKKMDESEQFVLQSCQIYSVLMVVNVEADKTV